MDGRLRDPDFAARPRRSCSRRRQSESASATTRGAPPVSRGSSSRAGLKSRRQGSDRDGAPVRMPQRRKFGNSTGPGLRIGCEQHARRFDDDHGVAHAIVRFTRCCLAPEFMTDMSTEDIAFCPAPPPVFCAAPLSLFAPSILPSPRFRRAGAQSACTGYGVPETLQGQNEPNPCGSAVCLYNVP
jgi:hypothetical protein